MIPTYDVKKGNKMSFRMTDEVYEAVRGLRNAGGALARECADRDQHEKFIEDWDAAVDNLNRIWDRHVQIDLDAKPTHAPCFTCGGPYDDDDIRRAAASGRVSVFRDVTDTLEKINDFYKKLGD